MYREGKTKGLHTFPETAADAANGSIYCRTLVNGNKVLRVLLFQYQEEQIPLQELEAVSYTHLCDVPEADTVLKVNGELKIASGSAEVLARYLQITVNGQVYCPRSLSEMCIRDRFKMAFSSAWQTYMYLVSSSSPSRSQGISSSLQPMGMPL